MFCKGQERSDPVNYESGRNWHVVNNKRYNATGQHAGYMLIPGTQTRTFFTGKLFASGKKQSFHGSSHLWAALGTGRTAKGTPASMYPTSNKVYDGLTEWTAKKTEWSGIMTWYLWYVAGITHIVRPEEWPIMSVHRMGFSYIPFRIFSGNLTLGISNRIFHGSSSKKQKNYTTSSLDPNWNVN